MGDVGLGSSAVEEKLHLLEEARLLKLVELGTEVLGVYGSSGLGESGSLYSQIR